MNVDLTQFNRVFFEEAEEHLAEMERLLVELDPAAPDPDDLNAVFRAAHSIKGGAGTFGFADMAEVTHVLESLLDQVRKGAVAMTPEIVDAALAAGDVIRGLLEAHRDGAEADPEAALAVQRRLAAAGGEMAEPAQAPAPRAPEEAAWGLFEDPADPSPEPAEEPWGLFDDAPGAPAAEGQAWGLFDGAPGAPAGDAEPAAAAAAQAVPEAAATPDGGTGPSARRRGRWPAESASLRVGVERVDQLINLVGELVITQAMLAQTAADLDPVLYERLLSGLELLDRNTRNLQEAVMSIRMVPMSVVFSRFPRLVRDLAGKLGKQVELSTVGEGTELDKGLMERLTDPLTHLVRNSLDHGLEPPGERVAAGKDPRGRITLSAFHQGGNVIIEVADDGRGLDRERILAKAAERGLMASEAMSDEEVFALLFRPGFSTASEVTDLSGRGVGMDVVKRNIQAMGGSVEMASQSGHGTVVTIRLPLTLAILDGLSVAVGEQTYILPLGFIKESLQPRPEDIRTVAGSGRLVHVRGEYLPLVALHRVFHLGAQPPAPEDGILVLAEAEGKRVAMLVDRLVGQHQVVIKSLESNFRKVEGISGATIMGDGQVALILDVGALVRMGARVERMAQVA